VLGAGIEKISSPGPDDDVEPYSEPLARERDGARAGSETASEKSTAELDPLRPAFFRGYGALDGFHADFDDHGANSRCELR
jgi:hypothetical protein